MNNFPLVSIIIPVYNGSNYLREAIDSALNQTYSNIEIIVVNDGSNDNGQTEAIALEYGNKIRYYSKENGGVSSALNLGISEMKGEYFSWLSHDDKYLPQKIENQVLSLKKRKNTISLCNDEFIDKNSSVIPRKRNDRFSDRTVFESDEVLKSLLLKGSFNGCALLIPKNILDECGTFNEHFRYIQDILMWITIFTRGYSLVYVKDKLCQMRLHDGQLTQKGRNIFLSESHDMYKLIYKTLANASNSKYNHMFFYAKHNAIIGNELIVKDIIHSDIFKTFSFVEKCQISVLALFGKIRPVIKKIFYKIVYRIKIS